MRQGFALTAVRGPDMLTLALAVLGALLLGASFEGTVRLPGILASCTFVRLGRVRLAAWCYRPGRLYLRLEAAR